MLAKSIRYLSPSVLAITLLAALGAAGCSSTGGQLSQRSETGLFIRSPSVIAAQSFVLVDAHGRPVAELSSAPQGGSGLVLLDSNNKARAALVVTPTGDPGLKLYDATGKVRTAVVISSDDRAGIALYDDSGHSRAALMESGNGESNLVIFGASGSQVARFPAH
jgi:hypothetical protein